ncbi:MAG TPA: cysteine desulfurase family protein [Aliidongia sp.]|uniref:cysteine desulfurase family protein n=1 Tax=Aliidongia sp. TaxID=1914230 RepID=UPI002DDCA6C6|nr:cysteine desulfurase family protein [Aliidongia sp.]HEV2674370.1 cysteine desulfurase family protein [Aliidongia sp.]
MTIVPVHPFVFLDHNATTPLRPAVLSAMVDVLGEPGNPSSVHAQGRAARRRVETARRQVAQALGVPASGEIVFTSGGTEANHLALRGLKIDGRVLRSAIEHDSVRAALPDAVEIPVTVDGIVDLAALERLLADGAALVSVMAANNETGALQPIAEIVRLAHAAGALVHCDAIQILGKAPFDMAALGLDLATVSAHKLGGPQGMAALALAPRLPLRALTTGGGQEKGYRAGTENVAGIVGFGLAIEAAVAELEPYGRLAGLRDRLAARLVGIDPAAVVFGAAASRVANTLCIAMPGVKAETQVMALDLAGIGVSAGSACSSGKVRISHVLTAMGIAPDLASAAIRISLGRDTTEGELDRLIEAWAALRHRTNRSAA